MDDVAIGKTAKTQKTAKLRGKAVVTGRHGTARRTVGLLGGIFSYAEEHGIVVSNPVRVTRSADGKRVFRLSLEEYKKLGQTLEEAEASGKPRQLLAIIRLLARDMRAHHGGIEHLHQMGGFAQARKGLEIGPFPSFLSA